MDLVTYPTLDLADPALRLGQHAIWWPAQAIKVPFQFAGRVQKLGKPVEASYERETIADEVAFLQWLALEGCAPPVHRWVYFQEVVSEHLGAWWCDPLGAYGYETEDAEKLPPGRFSIDWLRGTGLVDGSPGAWGDLAKPGNVVNGSLVDVRRSWYDRLRYLGPRPPMPVVMEDRGALLRDLWRDGAFPFRERESPYQEVYLDGQWREAERDVRARADRLGFAPSPGDSVVDLGCCSGGFLQYAALRGAGRMIGLDAQSEYIGLAKRLARANGMNIGYRRANLTDLATRHVLGAWLAALLGGRPVDHLLILSMAKHLGEPALWWWVDHLPARTVYLETNAVKPGTFPLRDEALTRGGEFLGETTDRNPRHIYRIRRQR